MKQFFSVDSPLFKFMQGVYSLVIINFCWLLGALPAIGGLFAYSYLTLNEYENLYIYIGYVLFIFVFAPFFGPATVAGCSVGLKLISDEEGEIFKQYFKAYKENFKQGLIIALLNAIAFSAAYMYFAIFNNSENGSILLLIVGFVVVFFFGLSFLYAYVLVARYEQSVRLTLRNSFRISLKFWPRTIGVVSLLAIEVFVFLWNSVLEFLGVIVGPAMMILTVSAFAKFIFIKLEQEQKSREA